MLWLLLAIQRWRLTAAVTTHGLGIIKWCCLLTLKWLQQITLTWHMVLWEHRIVIHSLNQKTLSAYCVLAQFDLGRSGTASERMRQLSWDLERSEPGEGIVEAPSWPRAQRNRKKASMARGQDRDKTRLRWDLVGCVEDFAPCPKSRRKPLKCLNQKPPFTQACDLGLN